MSNVDHDDVDDDGDVCCCQTPQVCLAVRNETKTSTIFSPFFLFLSTADNKGSSSSSSNGVVAQTAAAAVEADESHPSGRDGSSWTTATVQSTASATAASSSSSSSSQQTIDSSSSSSSSSSVCSQQEYEILKVKASAVSSTAVGIIDLCLDFILFVSFFLSLWGG